MTPVGHRAWEKPTASLPGYPLQLLCERHPCLLIPRSLCASGSNLSPTARLLARTRHSNVALCVACQLTLAIPVAKAQQKTQHADA